VLCQEFSPNNTLDTRVTVIEQRAFAFRRSNSENDFRTNGTAKIDYTPEQIKQQYIRLAFRIANTPGSQGCAIDGFYREGGFTQTAIAPALDLSVSRISRVIRAGEAKDKT
jgi:glutathione synthase/RimK-type ligase-like ATP-grasp enzyme